jgi:hypothetical protein
LAGWLAVTHDASATLLKDRETFVRDPANAGIRTQFAGKACGGVDAVQ